MDSKHSYENDFYISSSSKNTEWVISTTEALESRDLFGVNEERNKIGGLPSMMLAQSFIDNSYKIIIAYDEESDIREDFKCLDTLEDTFCKNHPSEKYRLIPVKLHPESELPRCLRQLHSLEAWKENFLDQLERSVKFHPSELEQMRKTAGKSGVTVADNGGGRRGDAGRQKAAKKSCGSTRQCMKAYHQAILRKHMENFASDLPYQRVLDRMSNVFTLEDEAEIKRDVLTDYNKRRTLVNILLKKEDGSFDLFVRVLENVCPHLAKALKDDVASAKVTAGMGNMKIT